MATRENPRRPNHASTPEEETIPAADEVLDAATNHDAGETEQAFEIDQEQELASIGAEIERIKESIGLITEATSHYVKRRVQEHSTDVIAENPLRATLWAAFIGFCVGRLSR